MSQDVTLHSGLQSSGVGTTVVDGSSRCSPPCSHVTSSAAHWSKEHLDHEQTRRTGQRCGRRSDYVWHSDGILESEEQEPTQINSRLEGLSCKR